MICMRATASVSVVRQTNKALTAIVPSRRKHAVCCAEPDQASKDNRANQLNPNNPNYQGGSTQYQGTGDKSDLDNRSDQLNPNNPKHEPGKDKQK